MYCAEIKAIGVLARERYQTEQVLPSVLMAQAYLETGNGKSYLATNHNNWFGIKYYMPMCADCDKVLISTSEYYNGIHTTIEDYFGSFKNLTQCLDVMYKWYAHYPKYAYLKAQVDYSGQCDALVKCGYATDPNYSTKLKDIIKREGLDKYDTAIMINDPVYINQYIIIAGSFESADNAKRHLTYIKTIVKDAFVYPIIINGATYYRVQVGAYSSEANANKFMAELKANGIDAFKEIRRLQGDVKQKRLD